MQIVRYTPDKAQEWDKFVEGSKNGTFLFMRGYMDYHSDRFTDHSLMYYSDKGKLLAIMPANETRPLPISSGEVCKQLYSHQGLTYGGFVLSTETRTTQVLEMFDITMAYLHEHGFKEWYYKQIPTCYHRCPAEEDEYALWRHGAKVISCGISTDIVLSSSQDEYRHMVSATKKTDCNKLQREGYTLERNADIEMFWPILTENLMRSHQTNPVHSIDEMHLLQSRFPNRIECILARNASNEVEAGTLIYKMGDIIHTQYMSASTLGKRNNTMDFLILSLVKQLREEGNWRVLDFGISTEEGGTILNEGLIAQKEGFGGRGIVYKQYLLTI